jgi:predicted membrane channel-forming protein YqfA (hemolysin III family)
MLSIFLSLPVAFLMWSVIWFAVGVVSYAWQLFPGSLPSPIGMTTSLGLVVFLSIGTWFGRIYVTRLKAHWKLWRLQNGSVGVQMEEQLDAEK